MNFDLNAGLPAGGGLYREFKFYPSNSVNVEIQCGVNRLEMPSSLLSSINEDDAEELFVSAHVVAYQRTYPLHEASGMWINIKSLTSLFLCFFVSLFLCFFVSFLLSLSIGSNNYSSHTLCCIGSIQVCFGLGLCPISPCEGQGSSQGRIYHFFNLVGIR